METISQRNYQPAESHSPGLIMSVFCCILMGNKHINQPLNIIFHYISTWKDQIPQKSKKRQQYICLIKLFARGISCKFWNTQSAWTVSQCVSAFHMKLKTRLFVSHRMSFLRAQSRHETRKRDVVSAHRWAGLQPMRNRFLLVQLSVWTVFAVIMLRKALEALRTFTANAGELRDLW